MVCWCAYLPQSRFRFVDPASIALKPSPVSSNAAPRQRSVLQDVTPVANTRVVPQKRSVDGEEQENKAPSAQASSSSACEIVSVSTPPSAPIQSASQPRTPMSARWGQKSDAELRKRMASLKKLRHTSMVQRAALACGDDEIEDSPEFLKLQEQSCGARIYEIEQELAARGQRIDSGVCAPDSNASPASSGACIVLDDVDSPPRRPEHRGVASSAEPTSRAPPSQILLDMAPSVLSASQERAAHAYPWSAQVQHALKRLFKLSAFRPDQLEAINATLSGQDVFCLMPTGGGKSLCYQLPATITQGDTDGLTVVVSPLIALIHNQVKNLLRRQIPTLAITGDMPEQDKQFACAELFKPDMHVRLLYLTPEFICNARVATRIFQHLYHKNRLARFVIDEAHCVDQWGHDFRPDYVRLSMLREQYPRVPLMALTATARIDTIQDIQQRLGMRNAVILRQSFNRPNLTYSVLPKQKSSTLDRMAEFIQARHANQCGIIYCLSRRDCENVAADLTAKFRIRARHFHAGLDTADKLRVQDAWEAGQFDVIVATIAFGMGIDKADVRFVIHHSMPKSLESYYQETGRAGRDGLPSECVLFWSMSDVRRLEDMLKDSDASRELIELQLQQLHQVVVFCQTLTECRRTNILKYFNERFDPAKCNASCDNCRRSDVARVDMTAQAKDFVNMLKLMADAQTHVTRAHCLAVFRGSLRKDVKDKGHHRNLYHGRGAQCDEDELRRLVDYLTSERVLVEYAHKSPFQRFASYYIKPGPNAGKLLHGKLPIVLELASHAAAQIQARRPVTPPPELDEFDIANVSLSPTEADALDALERAAAGKRDRRGEQSPSARRKRSQTARSANGQTQGARRSIAAMPM